MWKILGYNRKGHHTWLCNIEASSFDEAIAKARSIYGALYVTGAQPL